MAKKKAGFIGGMGTGAFLKDKDWITVIGALLRDGDPEGRRLAKVLLRKTKQGRHVRLVKLTQARRPRVSQMHRALKVSRRTLFRDLNDLEAYGIQLNIDDGFHYEVVTLPANFKKLLPRVTV